MDSWLGMRCPSCGKYNLVNNGDTDDLSGVDVEIVCCWSCRTVFTPEGDIGEDEELADQGCPRPIWNHGAQRWCLNLGDKE